MHSAIVVVKIPEASDDQAWPNFLHQIRPILRTDKGAKRLAENVWLVNFRSSHRALSWIVVAADQLGLTYGILPLADEPRWLPDGSDPSTN